MGDNTDYDAVIIGSGPNGLAAAALLAGQGLSVLVMEARESAGGGTRTAELTLPGFRHDVCSAVHPMGALSPWFRQLPLSEHGLSWIEPPVSVAHPLDGQPPVLLRKSVVDTAQQLDEGDARAYRRLMDPLLGDPHTLLADLMAPLRVPRAPWRMARFGWHAWRSARGFARGRFGGERARALFAGCAAHGIMPLDNLMTAAFGVLFGFTGHVETWPVARGGSDAITRALGSYAQSLGAELRLQAPVRRMEDMPGARAYLFDTSPAQLGDIAGEQLPAGYRRRLSRYRYGPGVFKVDWALDGPIPWRDPDCLLATTVHVGGTLEEIRASEAAMGSGQHAERPFLIVCQQSQFDDSRAPGGKHTGYAYCHVPHASTVDMTERIEAQIERFAPGFRQRILERHRMNTHDFQRHNANYLGGAITGGVADLSQLFTRPVARLDPYTTPNPRLFICSAASPPGGGVHGMCGYHAARSALKRVFDIT